jgi:small subunit ribosomal protein S20
MANLKSSIKRIDVIKRNTLRNKQNSSNLKTFSKFFILALEKYKNIPKLLNLVLVIENISLFQSKMDKARKSNILSKKRVAKKKYYLSLFNKFFLLLKKYKNKPTLFNLDRTLLMLSVV